MGIRPLVINRNIVDPYIDLLPMSSWSIAPKSQTKPTVWVTNNNTVNIAGIGGWNELIYMTYIPYESGTYLFTLKWNAPSIDFWNNDQSSYGESQRHLGVWFDTSLDIDSSYSYEGSMSQGIWMYDHDTSSPVSGNQTANLTLTADTMYYVWISLGTLEDYTEQSITFTEMNIRKV